MRLLVLTIMIFQMTFYPHAFAQVSGGSIQDSKGRSMIGECLQYSADGQTCERFKIGIADSPSPQGLYSYYGPISLRAWNEKMYYLREKVDKFAPKTTTEQSLMRINENYFYTPRAFETAVDLLDEPCLLFLCVVGGVVLMVVSPVIDAVYSSASMRGRVNSLKEAEQNFMDVSKIHNFLVDYRNAGKVVQVTDEAFDIMFRTVSL